MMERLRLDVAGAIRALRTTPATTAGAVLTLAVAVGINLAMFGLIDRALVSPPAHVADASRVFTLHFQHASPDGQPVLMATTSYVTFEAIREGVPAVERAAAWHRTSASAVVEGEQIQTEAMLVSGSYFPMLDVRPHIGRTILPDDDRGPSGSPVAVLSHAFWRKTFAGDDGVVGRRISLRGIEFVIVGVMPAGFSGHSAARVDVWVPIHAAMDQAAGWDRNPYRNVVEIGVRVRPDQSPGASAVGCRHRPSRRPVADQWSARHAGGDTIAYWLAGVSFLVLVVGLANTATLLLVRGARRRRELRIRAGLGATNGRLLSQLVVEAAVLAMLSVAAALTLASWFDEAVRRLLLPSLIESSGISLRMAGAAGIAGFCTLLVGAGVGGAQLRALGHAESLTPAARSRRRGSALLLVQTTLAVVLLAGAGMFGRSLHALAAQDFGMRMDGVLLVHFEQGSGSVPGQDQLCATALERIRALSGVALATPVGTLPFTGFNVPPFSVPGQAEPPTIDGQLPFLIAATPELFDILALERAASGGVNGTSSEFSCRAYPKRPHDLDPHQAPRTIGMDAVAHTGGVPTFRGGL
jgi:putative ABC transport system permease protein